MRENGDISKIKEVAVGDKMQKPISLKNKRFSCNGLDKSLYSDGFFS
jgi:hypothetical protein